MSEENKESLNIGDLTPIEDIKAELAKTNTQKSTSLGQVNFDLGAKKSQDQMPAPQSQTAESETQKLIGEAHKQAIIATIQNKEEVKERVLDQAERSIDNELKSLEQENIQRLQQTTYDANKEACSNYGINSNVPLWQVRLMKIGSAIWFTIYWVVASLIICPINVFCKGLKAFIKQSWLVIFVGVLLYLLITVGAPVLIKIITSHT